MGTSTVLDPTTSLPSGCRMTDVPATVVPGPPGTRVAPLIATADPDGAAVNARPSTEKVFGAGVCPAALMVLDPTTKFPPMPKLIGVPEMLVAGPPATRVAPSTTTLDGNGPAVKVNPSAVIMLDVGVSGESFTVDDPPIKPPS